MQLATVTSKGQITLPKDVRQKLRIKEGDKVLFMPNESGYNVVNASGAYFVVNPTKANREAYRKLQDNAMPLDAKQEEKMLDEIVAAVKEVRCKRNANLN